MLKGRLALRVLGGKEGETLAADVRMTIAFLSTPPPIPI